MSRNALSPEAPSIPVVTTTTTAAAAAAANPKWNTKQLGLRLGVDVASAAAAGALTCPVITVIDRAIIEKAAKGLPIRTTISAGFASILSAPRAFLASTPFLLIYTLYSATYLTANVMDTLTATLRDKPAETVFAGPAKFLSTTVVNMGICVYKDARFARIFGSKTPTPTSPAVGTGAGAAGASTCHPTAAQVPKVSYALFCLRDSITIFASFNVPPLLAPHIPDSLAATPHSKAAVAQFACPALMQFASTPMHLLGLDLYNRQPVGGLGWRERVGRIRRDYVPSCFARMGKIVPAYGVGGVANVRLREGMMKWLQG
ncbi:uncharacterized protein ACLA_054490 [Aspergillus clavatus NRRL 1]|uniref:Sequence orphan n=1 Tax=Aspergillus clavatus (strain ATCC 1007 / CBS 513.65 / DSM 816 / NCTC 3887 / NRRL 1 / QM 1276 / 107) TaxID=344612 RepID=A1C978_ASPCL|nr:uncharacterized protein ACLA_054490 [Aspergillus clavatus NRRL 1]EAW13402.1 conserved hypothetical protein [Aspergillus clavatus NRRL 1]